MSRRLPENPQDYKGPREVVRGKTKCGWCNDGFHESCKHETAYYEKLWVCSCECNKDWVPQDVGTIEPEAKDKKKRGKDVLRDLPLPTKTRAEGSSDSSHGDERDELPGGEDRLEREPALGDDQAQEERDPV